MKSTDEDQPALGTSMTSLGVRVRDLHPRVDGTVDPQEGGASVSVEGYEHLPRSVQVAVNNGKAAVFELETEDLPDHLAFREDPYDKTHVFIEPAHPMKFEAYKQAVQETSALWRRV